MSRERELELSIKHLISAVLNKQEWCGVCVCGGGGQLS